MEIGPNSDPANVAAVSGFYGPGAWSAYLCSLTSAWYTILVHPDTPGNSDLIVSLLYANWAAIDLLVHVVSHDPKTSYASVAAAATITVWALPQTVMQTATLLMIGSSDKVTGRRVMFTVAGSIIPFIGTVWLIHDITLRRPPRALPPGISSDGLTIWYIRFDEEASEISGFMIYAGVLVMVLARLWSIKPGFGAIVCSWAFCSLHAGALYLGSRYSTNFIKACAPQRIDEPDQSFALLCGLVALVYQLGPDAWHTARATVNQRQEYHYRGLPDQERDPAV